MITAVNAAALEYKDRIIPCGIKNGVIQHVSAVRIYTGAASLSRA